jgi:hypothetical protein
MKVDRKRERREERRAERGHERQKGLLGPSDKGSHPDPRLVVIGK